MNMTNLTPRCINNIYFNDYHPFRDLFKSVSLTLKNDMHYYNPLDSEVVPRQFLSDDLWEAISWIQNRFFEDTVNVLSDEHKKVGSNTVVVNHYNSDYTISSNTLFKPPDEAFDLVEGFIFINKNHEIPESIKRMMDEEEAERMLRG